MWFSQGIPVSSTNKTDRHDKTEILLKMTLNTTTQTPTPRLQDYKSVSILQQIGFNYDELSFKHILSFKNSVIYN
jgi:hypothetical protein